MKDFIKDFGLGIVITFILGVAIIVLIVEFFRFLFNQLKELICKINEMGKKEL